MLKININLALKPFVNKRKFYFILTFLVFWLAVSSYWNLSRYKLIHAYKVADSREMAANQKRLQGMEKEETHIRERLQRIEVAEFLEKIDYLNTLIEQRTFSWTQLLNDLETLTPDNVQIASIRPKVVENNIVTEIVANVRTNQDGYEFIANLEKSGRFFNVRPVYEDNTKTPGMTGKQIELSASYKRKMPSDQ